MLSPPRCAVILLTYRCRQVWEPPADTYGSKQIDTQDCDLSFRLVVNLSACIVAIQPTTAQQSNEAVRPLVRQILTTTCGDGDIERLNCTVRSSLCDRTWVH